MTEREQILDEVLAKAKIKKFGVFSGFDVWIVDGMFIRRNIEIEFTNFGQHFRFGFIPENEFWIDKEKNFGEEKFYITHMLIEHDLMKDGMNYYDALVKASLEEKHERQKSEYLKKNGFHLKKKKDDVDLEKIRKKKLERYSRGIDVWIVDGELVRGLFFIDFTEGGHDVVYSFVPDGEIWIDDDLSAKEIPYVFLHELHERNLMKKGMSYDEAHVLSSEIEHFCRNHPSKLDENLEAEFAKMFNFS